MLTARAQRLVIEALRTVRQEAFVPHGLCFSGGTAEAVETQL